MADLVVRPWASADAPALAAAWGVPDIAGQATVPGTGSVDDAARWIAGGPAREATGVSVDRAVVLDGVVVGEVGLARLVLAAGEQRRTEWEVGWWVLPDHRGRGIAAAAARLLLAETAVGRVVARIADDLTASQRVAATLGMTRLTPTLWST